MSSVARVLANQRNGAMSRGPKTAAGKRRAARNALKHGFCARQMVLLDDEDAAAFGAFEAAVRNELAPVGALQADLVARIVVAAWRAPRADRLEAALLGRYLEPTDSTNVREILCAHGGELSVKAAHQPSIFTILSRKAWQPCIGAPKIQNAPRYAPSVSGLRSRSTGLTSGSELATCVEHDRGRHRLLGT